jgi:hypothetical protein
MERPLKDHLRGLEDRLQQLHERVMLNSVSREERNQLEAEIRAANLAISHFRAALELERSLTPSR